MMNKLSRFFKWQKSAVNMGLMSLEEKGVGILDEYKEELSKSRLLEKIEEAECDFAGSVSGKTYRGNPYGFGGMKPEVSVRLYGLVRQVRPSVLVETGVCNGVSTAAILAAMEKNGEGELYSIDLPEYTDTEYDKDAFWEGKKGAAVPKGKKPGWLIPETLRQRWRLIIGSSRDELPPLLKRLKKIDFFLHDSEHSVDCMNFEYQAAWRHLKSQGLLVSDDIGWNNAFSEFATKKSRKVYNLARNIAFMVK